MAKGIGLIGNFKGKVGNMVGYKLTASNSGNTQGVRVYQPIVKNPKTSAQAEQRAKLAPINATYRALKMVIDRGNEGLPYGNKSRLAWLKNAFRASAMPWYEKGKSIAYPVLCPISKGSLGGFTYSVDADVVKITCTGVTDASGVATIGAISTLILAGCTFAKAGDQVSIVCISSGADAMNSSVFSFVLDATSTEATTLFSADNGVLSFNNPSGATAAAVILSREGVSGEHLRSNASLVLDASLQTEPPYDADSKTAAIESYMSSAAVNADWAEESIQ